MSTPAYKVGDRVMTPDGPGTIVGIEPMFWEGTHWVPVYKIRPWVCRFYGGELVLIQEKHLEPLPPGTAYVALD